MDDATPAGDASTQIVEMSRLTRIRHALHGIMVTVPRRVAITAIAAGAVMATATAASLVANASAATPTLAGLPTPAPSDSSAPVTPPKPLGPPSVKLTAHDGDGVIRLTQKACGGQSAGWEANAAANGIKPTLYIVLEGQVLTITCPTGTPTTPPAAPAPKQTQTQPAAAPAAASWHLPVDLDGCFPNYGGRQFGAPRYKNGVFDHYHAGLDLGGVVGVRNLDPIYAIHSGVVSTGYQENGAGLYVRLDHGDGTGSNYFHMDHRAVSAGAKVKAGQVIGYVGQTGNAAPSKGGGGPHLHFEVLVNGARGLVPGKVDPVKFLHDRDVSIRLC